MLILGQKQLCCASRYTCSSAAAFSGVLFGLAGTRGTANTVKLQLNYTNQRKLSHIHTATRGGTQPFSASSNGLKSCSFRYVFVCIFLHPSIALGPQVGGFFPEILILRKTSIAGCVPFFLHQHEWWQKEERKEDKRKVPWCYSLSTQLR